MSPSLEFTVYPAIDLRSGQVVRLAEGDPQRQTQYSSDPACAARRWIDAGARWLHVVNLDGALDAPETLADSPNGLALTAILRAAQAQNVSVQFGGGLRSLESIQAVLDLGVTRVVLGTVIVEQPEILPAALARWGESAVAGGLDARDGLLRIHGWQRETPVQAVELAQQLAGQGLRWLIFTDIARDGLQTGLNLSATLSLAEASGLQVIASGGVGSLADILKAKAAGLAGVIVGRALYEGTVTPEEIF